MGCHENSSMNGLSLHLITAQLRILSKEAEDKSYRASVTMMNGS